MTTSKTYGVTVIFNQQGYWSRRYTYKSTEPFKVDDIVVVESKPFYSVGKVVGCDADYEFSSNIDYKWIKMKVVPF